jgi:hypothetical protein
MGGHPVEARSRVDIRAEDVPDGINAADHAAGLSSSLDNLAAYVELSAGFLAATVLVATANIRVVATERQIYGRQLQQAGLRGPDSGSPNGRDLLVRAPPRPGDPLTGGDHQARGVLLGGDGDEGAAVERDRGCA